MRIEALALEAPPGLKPAVKPAAAPEIEGGDPRFRALLREEEWASLPPAIRRRFSKRLANGATAVYAGEVLETRMSIVGWLVAQALRLVGGPLPTAPLRTPRSRTGLMLVEVESVQIT